MTLLHGTSAEHARAIERDGLRPSPGDGVYLTAARRYALWVAQIACLRARVESGRGELEADGLIVHVAAEGLSAVPTGVLDLLIPSWRVQAIAPNRIVRLELVRVRFPARGSQAERDMLRAGFGQRPNSARRSIPAGVIR